MDFYQRVGFVCIGDLRLMFEQEHKGNFYKSANSKRPEQAKPTFLSIFELLAQQNKVVHECAWLLRNLGAEIQ